MNGYARGWFLSLPSCIDRAIYIGWMLGNERRGIRAYFNWRAPRWYAHKYPYYSEPGIGYAHTKGKGVLWRVSRGWLRLEIWKGSS